MPPNQFLSPGGDVKPMYFLFTPRGDTGGIANIAELYIFDHTYGGQNSCDERKGSRGDARG